MLPDMEAYRQYGRQLGEQVHPVDWEGFTQMKRWDHGFLPNLRRLAGFRDWSNRGTYTEPRGPITREALDALVEGFREGAAQ